MKVITRILAHLLLAFGLLVFVALPTNKYSWMKEMDPSITTLPTDDGSGNRTTLTLLLLIAVVATQLAIAATSANKKERTASIVLVLVAISVWLAHHW